MTGRGTRSLGRGVATGASGWHPRGAYRGRGGGRGGRAQQYDAPLHLPSAFPVLVVDLEATCWEDNEQRPRGEYNEIIEIGWALLDCQLPTDGTEESASSPSSLYTVTKQGTILVKPTRSTVSPFCTSLTSITPDLLEAEGTTLSSSFSTLTDTLNSKSLHWGSWGDYDRKMLLSQSSAFNLPYPFSDSDSKSGIAHFNIKNIAKHPTIQALTGYRGQKGWGMKNAYERIVGKEIEGTHHRGGDDALNIATMFGHILDLYHKSQSGMSGSVNTGPR